MHAEPGIRRRSVVYRALLFIVALLLSACGSVQIFDSFGEDETQAPAAPDQRTTSMAVENDG